MLRYLHCRLALLGDTRLGAVQAPFAYFLWICWLFFVYFTPKIWTLVVCWY